MISVWVTVMGSLVSCSKPQSPSPDPSKGWMCNLNTRTGSPRGSTAPGVRERGTRTAGPPPGAGPRRQGAAEECHRDAGQHGQNPDVDQDVVAEEVHRVARGLEVHQHPRP